MKSNTLLVGSSLVFIVGVSIYTKPSSKGLELPSCNMGAVVDTEIHFFVDNEVLERSDTNNISVFLKNSLKQSNVILTNSCVPLSRSLGDIKYVDLDKTKVKDIFTAHTELENFLGVSDLDSVYPQPNQFYGLVFDKKYEKALNLSGQAQPMLSEKFFTVSSGAHLHIIEHELGHLAWAQHTETHPNPNLSKWLKSIYPEEYSHKLKSYARAYKCGTGGTVMSYEKEIVPVYSSPDIYYREQKCGDVEVGDNARVMREFALKLAASNTPITF